MIMMIIKQSSPVIICVRVGYAILNDKFTFKGISICFNMLKAALSGGYVNFGVFSLYGDDALNNALNMFVKLAYSIPRKDILVSQCMREFVSFQCVQ